MPVVKPRPLLLDLYCGQGGAAMGYYRAGFHVIGVDDTPQPRYPFRFVQFDAIDFLIEHGCIFDAIHASPPCQRFSDLAHRNRNRRRHKDLITPTRRILRGLGLPYVIENVDRAPLRSPVMLCGSMFAELRVIRHRAFECTFDVSVPEHGPHGRVFTYDKRKPHYLRPSEYVSVNGGGNSTAAEARVAMGIDWMSKRGLNEAVPPAYTRLIGRALMSDLRSRKGL